MTKVSNIAIFASGSGTNAAAIFQHFHQHPAIHVAMLLSNNAHAYALERARKRDIITHVFSRSEFYNTTDVLQLLQASRITHIVLAGFLWLVPDYLIRAYPDRIINIHPALLPKYGGKGMYGMKVHEAVQQNREVETGITIHQVNERFDEGEILFQERCIVAATDSPDDIAEKVHQLEHRYYPAIIEQWIKGELP